MYLWLFVNIVIAAAELPAVDYNVRWGPDEPCDDIWPFRITFDDHMISDLRMRLRNHRSPAPTFDNVDFEYGFNTNGLDSWLKYWAEDYDFKQREIELNKYPQYKILVQGLKIHFIRVEPENKSKRTVPLLLLHGWPGSTREFYDVIPYLTADNGTRDFAIEVIIPSLPGFGFSDGAGIPGLGAVEMAVVMRNLMHKLGHNRFYVQGGDWGSFIGSIMATLFPKEVAGFHTNLPTASTKEAFMMMILGEYIPDLVVDSSLADRIYPLKNKTLWLIEETGYFHYQATKPDTLGVALSDSPAGLLAFLLQGFSSGTRRSNTQKNDGGLLAHYTRDQLLDNVMMYWTDNKITTSSRIYYETTHSQYGTEIMAYPTEVPVWALQAPDEIIYMSPQMLKTKFKNLLHATTLDEGGHFLALERPTVFAEDVLQAIQAFITWNDSHGY